MERVKEEEGDGGVSRKRISKTKVIAAGALGVAAGASLAYAAKRGGFWTPKTASEIAHNLRVTREWLRAHRPCKARPEEGSMAGMEHFSVDHVLCKTIAGCSDPLDVYDRIVGTYGEAKSSKKTWRDSFASKLSFLGKVWRVLNPTA